MTSGLVVIQSLSCFTNQIKNVSKNYFNTAAAGLIPAKYTAKLKNHFSALNTDPNKENFGWLVDYLPPLRAQLAEFCDADTDEIAIIPNFSFALSTLVYSLKQKRKVLLYEKDYPSLIDPFLINDFEIHRVNDSDGFTISLESIQLKLLEKRIDILAISHVQWISGFKIDLMALGKFCKEHDILFIVDATQSMGGLEISFKDTLADVLITSNYKWMNAGFGTGILCASKSFLQKYPPKVRGNTSRMLYGKKWNDDSSILGYEPGHLNITGLLLLSEALKDKLHTGVHTIEIHNLQLTEYFIGGLPNAEKTLLGTECMQNRSGIIALHGGELLYNHLIKKGFNVSFRGGMVRLSFHYHNTKQEIDDLLTAVAGFNL